MRKVQVAVFLGLHIVICMILSERFGQIFLTAMLHL